MKKIAEYNNGNVHVIRFEDGTVLRYSKDNEFNFAFPENMDIKLTDRCTGTNCPYCHEGSGANGKHGDIMTATWVDTIHPYTECALGGGNILEHPDLIPFLYKLKRNKVYANITVNQIHFMQNRKLLEELQNRKLIYGIGISFNYYDEDLFKEMHKFPNAVLHIIAGILTEIDLYKIMSHHDLKILVLGYKKLRRGERYYQADEQLAKGLTNIDKQIKIIEKNLSIMFASLKIVSFDCLAIEQLHIKKHLPITVWNQFYQGEDGSMTFYIDMVNDQFAESSTASLDKRYYINNKNVNDMFQIIKENHYVHGGSN